MYGYIWECDIQIFKSSYIGPDRDIYGTDKLPIHLYLTVYGTDKLSKLRHRALYETDKLPIQLYLTAECIWDR